MDKLYYGVAYYDEYMPEERLSKDIALMKEAGINVVRIAESTWSTYEPQDNVFDFTSVDRVLDAMYEADIDVIIGTPTYTVPTWLVKSYPDVLAETKNGKGEYGARQIMDITNPTYLFHAERIIRKLMNHVSNHPAVIGYQTDNETKHYGTVGKNVQIKFVKYLKEKYESLDIINEKFGLDYWGNRINAWEDFPSVVGTINGSLGAEFQYFQRTLVDDFLKWQVDIVNEYKKQDQFVTQNFDFEWRDYSFGIQPDVDHFKSSKHFDITGVDIYHPGQDKLTGTEISFGGDVTRSTKQKNYLVLETQSQGFPEWQPYPGQLKLQAFSHVASGAAMVSYWHWHSIHNSFETYWKGLISHDFKPNYVFEEATEIGKSFNKLSPALTNLKKNNEVAFLISNESFDALEWFKLSRDSDINYNDILRRYYDEFYKLNIETDILSVTNDNDYSKYKLIIIPALYTISDYELTKLNKYVENGGHVLYTFKTGFTDENIKVRTSSQPGIIDEVTGIYYNAFAKPNNVKLIDTDGDKIKNSKVEEFMELITPTTAEVLAYYDHPHWGKYAAITTNEYGKGRATYIGGLIDTHTTKSIIKLVAEYAEVNNYSDDIQSPIIIKSAINSNNEKIYFVFNYSDEEQKFTIPFDVSKELLEDKSISQGDIIQLERWDVKIFKER